MDEEKKGYGLLDYVVTLVLVVLNLAAFALEGMVGSSEDAGTLLRLGAWYTPFVCQGQYFRFVSSMFLHIGINHLSNNMLSLAVLGHFLEPRIGHLRLFFIFMAGGMLGNLTDLVWDLATGDNAVSAGASGGICALLGAITWLVLFRREKVRELTLPRLGLALVCLVVGSLAEPNVDVVAHIGGFVGGFAVCALSFAGDKGIV